MKGAHLKDTRVCGQPGRRVRGTAGGGGRPKQEAHGRPDGFHVDGGDFAVAERKLGGGERPVQVTGARLRARVEDVGVPSSERLQPRAPPQPSTADTERLLGILAFFEGETISWLNRFLLTFVTSVDSGSMCPSSKPFPSSPSPPLLPLLSFPSSPSPPHLLLLAERFRRSCSRSPVSDTMLCVDSGGDEADGETLSLATDSSLKKSDGRTAASASGSCVPRPW
ncbi:hypothetical protein EYF80_009955 [Liparis tanakae]|uniref:Uncharacterized protein n=1 Tax=Liparis tanakae TaxID=230148 RepID=A0A4Z2IQG6_9TELE|nr:hypothetical protein EYF80_009955 [Liparis tanakae]